VVPEIINKNQLDKGIGNQEQQIIREILPGLQWDGAAEIEEQGHKNMEQNQKQGAYNDPISFGSANGVFHLVVGLG
jgi:hypothetical protein